MFSIFIKYKGEGGGVKWLPSKTQPPPNFLYSQQWFKEDFTIKQKETLTFWNIRNGVCVNVCLISVFYCCKVDIDTTWAPLLITTSIHFLINIYYIGQLQLCCTITDYVYRILFYIFIHKWIELIFNVAF